MMIQSLTERLKDVSAIKIRRCSALLHCFYLYRDVLATRYLLGPLYLLSKNCVSAAAVTGYSRSGMSALAHWSRSTATLDPAG